MDQTGVCGPRRRKGAENAISTLGDAERAALRVIIERSPRMTHRESCLKLRATLERKQRAGDIAAGAATQVQKMERCVVALLARRSIEHTHAVRELRDAVARAHAAHATWEAQLAEAATRGADARATALLECGEAVAELAASWETVVSASSDRRVSSVKAHAGALLALTARHDTHAAECERLVRQELRAVIRERTVAPAEELHALHAAADLDQRTEAATLKYTLKMSSTKQFFTPCATLPYILRCTAARAEPADAAGPSRCALNTARAVSMISSPSAAAAACAAAAGSVRPRNAGAMRSAGSTPAAVVVSFDRATARA